MLGQLNIDGTSPSGAAFRWGMLAFILLLIAYNFLNRFSYSSTDWQSLGMGLVCPVMLLLNHLAFAFKWPGLLGFTMNVLAISWSIIGGILVFAFP